MQALAFAERREEIWDTHIQRTGADDEERSDQEKSVGEMHG